MGVHNTVRIEQILNIPVYLKNLRRFLKMKKLWLMQTNPMLSTDASFVFCHFLKNVSFIELLNFRQADVDMQISIANVPVRKHKCLRFFS